MDIKYQTLLRDYPTCQDSYSSYVKRLKPITLDEIESLENTYNSRNQFPASLREILFLAGNYCYVLDFGLFKTQGEMQANARLWLSEYDRSISRPFFVVDVYNAGDQFLFVYLDEDQNDPEIYEAYMPDDENIDFIHSLRRTLSEFITIRMKRLLSGENPF